MTPRWRETPHLLLTVHFLRQFLENDLISPEADRSQLVAVVSTAIVSLTLFVSAILSFAYVMNPVLTPGQAAVLALNDRFFYLGLGMIVTALVAAAQWDALSIDARDAAILEPLPVRAGTIRRAKLSAVAILGAAAAIGVNLCPSIVFPSLLVFTFRQMELVALLWLIATHAIFTIAASAFGYLTIVAFREVLVAVLGIRSFTRVSPWIQGALIVMLGGSLLLLPAASNNIVRRGFDSWRAASPPMWFLGAYEMAAGGVIADLPRTTMRPRQANADAINTAAYQRRRPELPALARRAWVAVILTFLVGTLAYAWNARRLPSLAASPPAALRPQRVLLRRVANALLVRRAAARAGFYFAIAAMWRSNTHRLTLACAAAIGFALAVVSVSSINLQSGSINSPRLLAVQPLLYGALLVGFRHAIRVPAELRANWGVQLAWRGEERAFIAGVKIAAIVALVSPVLVALLPIFSFVLGPLPALIHAMTGLAGAIVLLEALMVNYEKVPFTCTYLPSENMKALAPIYAIAFIIGASIFARMEYDVLQGTKTLGTVLTLAGVFGILRVMSLKRGRLPYVEFDEAPVSFQRLGLDR
jgi:hypothetical protein